MSNIEDIKILESMIEEYENCSVPEVDMQVNITFREKQAEAINNILSEREQYKKRIKELEEENKENKKKYLGLLIGQFPDTTETYKKYKKELQELLE